MEIPCKLQAKTLKGDWRRNRHEDCSLGARGAITFPIIEVIL